MLGYNDRRRGKLFREFIGKGKKILDLGIGEICSLYCDSNEVYGADISEERLRKVRKYCHKVYRFDVEKRFPFKDKTFDVVVAGEIIEHLINPENLVKEAKRVLKDNGVFIGSTPNAFSWRRRLEVLFGFLRYEPTTTEHIRFFNLSSLKKLLNRHFDKVTITTFTPIKVWKSLLATSFIWKCKK